MGRAKNKIKKDKRRRSGKDEEWERRENKNKAQEMEFEQNGSSENLLGLESPEDHQENVVFD